MKSTGECLGIAKTFEEALYKAFLGAGIVLPKFKQMIITVKDADKGDPLRSPAGLKNWVISSMRPEVRRRPE